MENNTAFNTGVNLGNSAVEAIPSYNYTGIRLGLVYNNHVWPLYVINPGNDWHTVVQIAQQKGSILINNEEKTLLGIDFLGGMGDTTGEIGVIVEENKNTNS